MLLLDEPSNDLDVETLRALEDALLNSPAASWSSPRPLVPRPHRHPHRDMACFSIFSDTLGFILERQLITGAYSALAVKRTDVYRWHSTS